MTNIRKEIPSITFTGIMTNIRKKIPSIIFIGIMTTLGKTLGNREYTGTRLIWWDLPLEISVIGNISDLDTL